MDWFPLYNSIRISVISTAATFFLGILAAKAVWRLPVWLKGLFDCVFTLPLVIPPTVVGFFILKAMSPNSPFGVFWSGAFGLRLVMTWYAAVFAVSIIIFPLMYRTARGAFEALDYDLVNAGRTLGISERYIFWRIVVPCAKKGLIAGVILSFARALGEYGATNMVSGYTPGRTAAISTTVYQLWREGNETLAYKWVLINIAISLIILVILNIMEKRRERGRA